MVMVSSFVILFLTIKQYKIIMDLEKKHWKEK